MNLSLKYKIAIVIFLLEAVMMTAVLWSILGRSLANTEKQIAAAEQVTLDIVGDISRVALLNEDYDRVQGYIESLTDNPGVLKALLVDDRNVIVASSSLSELGENMPKLVDSGTTHWRTNVLDNASGQLGLLIVQFSQQAWIGSYQEIRDLGILIAATGMGMIVVFGLGFGYLLTYRLQKVVQTANQVAQGDYSVRTHLRGRDEVAQVGAAFDTMADVIAEEQRQLAHANQSLEQRVKERTRELEDANHEYESFAYAISHDLRAPLRSVNGFSQALVDDYSDKLDDTARNFLDRIRNSALRMAQLIDDLLTLSRVNRAEISSTRFDISKTCHEVVEELRAEEPSREINIDIQAEMIVQGDPHLIKDALTNLISNAWKFTCKTPNASIHFHSDRKDGDTVYIIEDNGAGFDMDYADKLFTPFQRLHHERDFPGTGIGLSTVQRIIYRHGGKIWTEGRVDQGATFYFTLGDP
ncbi:MAG TPA: HAMP domain-containing protein [Gammaproteobacteria bacterium]|nr:HAMP domain-containing protein [Gammaproteobacteria bacterium]